MANVVSAPIKNKFRKGDLIEVFWSDPQGCINDSLDDLGTAQCVTRGTVLKLKGNKLCLWHGRYVDDANEDVIGDGTALDIRNIDSWKVLVRKEDLYDPEIKAEEA